MNRCIVLVLPLLFLLSSCGTTAQFAQQRFQDGIYSRPEPVAEAVQIYSKDDFAAMAAANIAREGQQKDTVYVVVRDNDWYDSPWFAWGSAWALSWPYRWWAWSSWYDPWYGPWGYPVAYQPAIHHDRRYTGTGLRTGAGLSGSRLTASGSTVRQTGTAVRGTNTVRSAGTVRQAVTSDKTIASTVRPTVSVVRGNTASVHKTTALKATATRVSHTGTAISVNSGRTTAVGNFKPVGDINSGNRYVQAGTAVRAESLNRTAGPSYRATNSSYRRAATSTATSFRNPFEMRRGTATVSSSLNGTGFNRTATSAVRSNGYSRTNNAAYNRSSSSSRTFNNSSATRSISRSSFNTSGSRSSFSGGSSSSGGSVRSVRR